MQNLSKRGSSNLITKRRIHESELASWKQIKGINLLIIYLSYQFKAQKHHPMGRQILRTIQEK